MVRKADEATIAPESEPWPASSAWVGHRRPFTMDLRACCYTPAHCLAPPPSSVTLGPPQPLDLQFYLGGVVWAGQSRPPKPAVSRGSINPPFSHMATSPSAASPSSVPMVTWDSETPWLLSPATPLQGALWVSFWISPCHLSSYPWLLLPPVPPWSLLPTSPPPISPSPAPCPPPKLPPLPYHVARRGVVILGTVSLLFI